ncbi:MAG TPA: hypothetical protein VG095_05065 [Chthoniobacterales bacterium]|nr:hypothetical protein [Chthoniobacterales bacterium]
MKMRITGIHSFLCACIIAVAAHAQTPHTPKPGSAERQAICDGARAYVMSRYVYGQLRQPIVFKIGHLRVLGPYANLEAIPIYKDGSYIDPDVIPDIGYNFCLRESGGTWKVIADLSRSDVPSAEEMAEIRQRLGPEFPRALLAPMWRRWIGEL